MIRDLLCSNSLSSHPSGLQALPRHPSIALPAPRDSIHTSASRKFRFRRRPACAATPPPGRYRATWLNSAPTGAFSSIPKAWSLATSRGVLPGRVTETAPARGEPGSTTALRSAGVNGTWRVSPGARWAAKIPRASRNTPAASSPSGPPPRSAQSKARPRGERWGLHAASHGGAPTCELMTPVAVYSAWDLAMAFRRGSGQSPLSGGSPADKGSSPGSARPGAWARIDVNISSTCAKSPTASLAATPGPTVPTSPKPRSKPGSDTKGAGVRHVRGGRGSGGAKFSRPTSACKQKRDRREARLSLQSTGHRRVRTSHKEP